MTLRTPEATPSYRHMAHIYYGHHCSKNQSILQRITDKIWGYEMEVVLMSHIIHLWGGSYKDFSKVNDRNDGPARDANPQPHAYQAMLYQLS